ncbi:MAG TPA: YbaB/EbfC family nucleoid-associated protein [Actinophytocola sp.]|jgi:DNA-binding protein YbaB|nr:YbaB/EbfC family nucleoid-associated protein [Actinophytocola sp.]
MTMPQGFEALHQLRGEAERMSRVLGAAQDPDATFEGQDETETVTAVVDMDGVVTDVRLEREWYDKVDARMLGAAVIEAVDAAGVARLTGWAEKVAEAEEEEPPASTAATPIAPSAPFDINPSGEMIDQLLYLLHRAGSEAEAEAKTAAAAAQARPRPVRGRSDGGHITVALDGKQVVEVRIETDTRWIGTANHLEIASELHDALAAAYRNAAEAAPRRRSDSAINELQALTADPQEFVAKLFGVRPPQT